MIACSKQNPWTDGLGDCGFAMNSAGVYVVVQTQFTQRSFGLLDLLF
jgi:hypothetical protein